MPETTISTANAPDTSISAATDAFAQILAPSEDTREEGKAQEAPEESEAVEAEAEDEQSEEETEEVDNSASDDDADPDDDEESDDEEEAAPQVYTIKVDGEEIEVTLEELQKGYSRTQDYTRKTQKLAEERKAALAEIETVRAERQQYSQLLDAMRQQLASNAPAEPNWEALRQTDPIEFAAQWADHQRRQQQMAAIQAEQQRMNQIAQYEQAQQLSAVVAQERVVLEDAIPEWKDKEIARREKAELVEFGRKLGFQTEELANITDHRAVVALRKAYMYDRLMSNKAKVKPVQKPSAPTLKPGAASAAPKKNAELTRAKQRLAKTGRVQDAATAFENILLGRK
jgi:hypothetical protein